jgi:rare lipoprotein A
MKTLLTACLVMLGLLTVKAGETSGTRHGTASWYGAECSTTASGERYDPGSMTAAHPTLPFGTLVHVTNLGSGCSVTVRINNRGPFTKHRVIDVSKAAAEQLKMIRSGTAKVEYYVVK